MRKKSSSAIAIGLIMAHSALVIGAQDRQRFNYHSLRSAQVTVVSLEGEQGPTAYSLNFTLYDGDSRMLLAYSGGWYEGTVIAEGTSRQCMLIDYNANGTFNDKSLETLKSDRIRIITGRTAKTRFVGNYIEIEDRLYRLEVARGGTNVKLAVADDAALGSIRLPRKTTEFAAGGENGLFICKQNKGIVELPLGRYHIDNWSTDTWANAGNMPAAGLAVGVTAVGDKICVTGGNFPSIGTALETLWAYDPATGAWQTDLPNMNVARGNHRMVAVGDHLFAIGGHNPIDGVLSSVEWWTPGASSWVLCESLNIARHAFGAGVVGNTIYVLDGSNGPSIESATIGSTIDRPLLSAGNQSIANCK